MKKESNIYTDKIKRVSKVQVSQSKKRATGQYLIQIPKEIAIELELEKGDVVEFEVPLKDKKNYSIKFKKKIK